MNDTETTAVDPGLRPSSSQAPMPSTYPKPPAKGEKLKVSHAAESAEAQAPERPKSLAPVIKIIPESCYDNPTWKGLAYVARDTVVHIAVLAAIALVDTWWALIPLFILSGLTASGLFILGHDAAHGALFKTKKMNEAIARLVMLPSWHVLDSWVFGHNRLHHGHTVREGVDFVWHPITVEQYTALPSWKRALVRVEWSFLGAGLYYWRNIWLNMIRWKQPPSRAKVIHRDQLFVFLFMALGGAAAAGAGWALYGTVLGAVWMPIKLIVVPAMMFMWCIGLLVYVHHIEPNIRWYPRSEWNKFKGQMEGTTIKHVPFWLDFFLHRIMIHVPHHVDMRIPFYHLQEAADAIVEHFPDVVRVEKFSWLQYVKDTRACKLYDFEGGRWLPYPKG
jgi:omega-6 fatty acid desaturase (delta-12 desaturase)